MLNFSETGLVVALLFSVTIAIAGFTAVRRDRLFLMGTVFLVWLLLLPLVFVVHEWLPFAGGGDDRNYYETATVVSLSSGDWFDLSRYNEFFSQPGYPWLLSLLIPLAGQDLLVLKLTNLVAFVLVALVWYRIAVALEGPAFARTTVVVVLMLTPMWHYTFFLLKDLVIGLLQSLFVLGLIYQSKYKTLTSWLLIGVATIAVIPFRSQLVLTNAAVTIAALALPLLSGNLRRGSFIGIVVGCGAVAALLVLATNPDFMTRFGISDEARVIGSQAMMEQVEELRDQSPIERAIFPLLYLFVEVSGMNAETWQRFDVAWLRGVLALPWIFFVVPLFVLGVRWLLLPTPESGRAKDWLRRLRNARLLSTPWLVVFMFFMAYLSLSWIVGDTTRWRLADMPAIGITAVAGWRYTPPHIRRQTLFVWLTGATILFSVFYLLRGMS